MVANGKEVASPTPEEIRRRCAEIRASWSDDTYYLRAGFRRDSQGRLTAWHVPEFRLNNLPVAPAADDNERF